MIVPSLRLLAIWTLAGVPLAGIAGALPAGRPVALAGLLGLGLVAAFDAGAVRRRARRVELSLPGVARFTRGRDGTIEIGIHRQPGGAPTAVRIGLPATPLLDFEREEWEVALGAAERSSFRWPVRATTRGRALLERFAIGVASPLGLWEGRRIGAARCELRVYPELGTEGRRVALRLRRLGAVGAHAVRQLGAGREFDRLREYVSGDPLDEIHWKATARRGRPISKAFQVERTQEIYVAIDRSRLSGRRFGEQPALETFLRAALVLALATRRHADRFGLVLFSDRVERFLRAGSGRAHFNACREALFDGEARPVAPDFGELASFLRTRLHRRALIVVLTDLEDPVHAESYLPAVRMLSGHHLVMTFGLRGAGVEPLFTSPAGDVAAVYERLAGHRRWQKLEELRRVLARLGSALHLAAERELIGEVVSRYAAAKARQAL